MSEFFSDGFETRIIGNVVIKQKIVNLINNLIEKGSSIFWSLKDVIDKEKQNNMKLNNIFKLAIAIVVSELAGIIGSVFTTPSIPTWYTNLARPALNPPAWVFGPVWTTLFALMGIAAFLVWKKGMDRKDVKIALGIFCGQLVLNTLWSIIFFGLHSPGGAFIEIIFLWLAILATIFAFVKISKLAAWLLVPYIAWVSFAAYLNYSIWMLN